MKALLEILDETNCRFHGLDTATRNKMVAALKFMVPYARHLPQVKLGRWDGKVSFCTVGGYTYVNLLDKVLPIVLEAGYELEVEDRRKSYDFRFPVVDERYLADNLSSPVWPKGHPHEGKEILLRDYQVNLINECLDNLQSVTVAATGSGKTITTATLSHLVEPYGRSIVIVPSKSLVTQTEEDYRNLGLDVGVFYGDRKEYGKTHTISTWQSLSILSKKTKWPEDFPTTPDVFLHDFLDGVVCVMVDECFDGDMRVLTPRGYRKIRDIQPGDEVINYDEAGGFKTDVVVKQHQNISPDEEMMELIMDTGAVIHVTGNHRFLTENRGWVRADELTMDDVIISHGGEE